MFREKKLTTVETSSCSEFNDHSTMSGKTKIVLSRIQWQHVVIASAVVAFLAFCAIVAAHWEATFSSYTITENGGSLSPRWIQQEFKGTNSKPPGFYLTYHGTSDDASIFQGLTQPWWSQSSVPMHLKIRNAIVNASQLVTTLVGCQHLESIDIEATLVIGHYVPAVYLPELKNFVYNFVGVDTSGFKFYRDPSMLKEILFFEPKPLVQNYSTWDLKTDLTNLGVNISVTIGGKKLVQINRALGLITLNVDYGWEVLENVKGSYSSLAIVSCPWATKPSKGTDLTLPSDLIYLNLFNITRPLTSQIPIQFGQLINEKSVAKLQTLIFYQSTLGLLARADADQSILAYQVELNLSIFSPFTLQKLSLRGINLSMDEKAPLRSLRLRNVTDLTLDSNNLTSPVLDQFDTIFDQVKTVRLFNLGGEVSSLFLLAKVLTISSLERILVTKFDWTQLDDKVNGGIGQVVRNTLLSFGLVRGPPNFKIIKLNTTHMTASLVTEEEGNWERYLAMGFQDVESFEHYRVNL